MKKLPLIGLALTLLGTAPFAHATIGQPCGNPPTCGAGEVCNTIANGSNGQRPDLSFGPNFCVAKPQSQPVACPLDFFTCPDGSVFGRIGPNCQFPQCPMSAPAPSSPPSGTGPPAQVPSPKTDIGTGPPAQVPQSSVTLINPLGSGITDVPSLIGAVMQFVVYVGSILVVFMLIYVGFLFVTARGNPGKVAEARSALLWTVIGALILIGAEVIAKSIEATVKALGS